MLSKPKKGQHKKKGGSARGFEACDSDYCYELEVYLSRVNHASKELRGNEDFYRIKCKSL